MKATASVVANLRPMHWRGPKSMSQKMRQKDWTNKPMLKAENSTSDEFLAPYHRDGLYSSGSEKYRGLFSGYRKSVSSKKKKKNP
jgi:hypothetical protein